MTLRNIYAKNKEVSEEDSKPIKLPPKPKGNGNRLLTTIGIAALGFFGIVFVSMVVINFQEAQERARLARQRRIEVPPTQTPSFDSTPQPTASAPAAPIPTPSPTNTPAREWHEVARWAGRAKVNTQPFTIASSPWRISYQIRGTSGFGVNFSIHVNSLGNGDSDLIANTGEPITNSTFVYMPPGQYYLAIDSLFADWIVVVEEPR